MLALGLMSFNFMSELGYFTEIAKASAQHDITVYRFSPENIDTQNDLIKGEWFDIHSGIWLPASFPVPPFIYDRLFQGMMNSSERTREKIKWLKDHSTFLGYGLPGKWEVFQSVARLSGLKVFFPETSKIYESRDIWAELHKHGRIMLKPEFGSGGMGIYLLSKDKNSVRIRMTKKDGGYERTLSNVDQIERWFSVLLSESPYICQQYLELSNRENRPYDVRLFLQKDERNIWTERGRGVRVGSKHAVTANLAAGAKAIPFQSLLRSYPADIQKRIENSISVIKRTLPQELEKRFRRLFELGIDIGIDRSGKVWILDINSKPGRKLIEQLLQDKTHLLYSAPLLYCKYLDSELVKAGD
ncbi:YheC/YheD family protein [Peribacillus sp. SCS-155]|uniref:YheC/YheD family endospore coat-associated protein n=1 Tax=Peribacillus sedimenti TaxID=3115297 RepID=UPI003905BCE9